MRYNTSVSGIKRLLKISRPRFWIYIFGPYIIGLAAAASNQYDFASWKVLLFGIFFLFPANLLIYGVNDIFDFETDALNQKKLGYETLVDPGKAKALSAFIFIFNLPFVVSSYLLTPEAALTLLGFYFFSVFYSAPPIRAKTKPFLDSIFNVLYVFPGIFAYKILSGDYPPIQLILAAGLWTMAMHAYSAIPDIKADKAAGIKTVATVLGSNATHIFCLVLYVGSALLAFKYIGGIGLVFGIMYILVILVSIRLAKADKVFKVYRYFPYVNALIGFSLFWYIAASKVL